MLQKKAAASNFIQSSSFNDINGAFLWWLVWGFFQQLVLSQVGEVHLEKCAPIILHYNLAKVNPSG